ncbi:MAG: winged helix-turn-helix domain-containing protein [Rhodospirillales bacterium]|nr:winged helix-turn-helix domain-containing protein [Rhodospirillales bacterium]
MQVQRGDIQDVNGCRLDIHRGVLERDGCLLPIRPKAFATLCYLARNRGRVVGKDELIQAVWGGLAVTDDVLTQTVKAVRGAIDDGTGQVLRTIPRRGYMLAAPGTR